MVSQKAQLCSAPNCALVKVDRLGTFSDRISGTPSWPTKRGQGAFPVPFGLPLRAKLVQAATSSSESLSSDAVRPGDWLAPETPRMPPCQPGQRNWVSIVWAAKGVKPGMAGE